MRLYVTWRVMEVVGQISGGGNQNLRWNHTSEALGHVTYKLPKLSASACAAPTDIEASSMVSLGFM